MSSAKVSIWNQTIGYLYWDTPNQVAIFEADDSYVDASFNIAPFIQPDKNKLLSGGDFHQKFKGLIPTFNDSLPDAFGNTVFLEWMAKNNMSQSEMNPVERLLYVGRRGAGALEYEVGKDIPNISGEIDINELAGISDLIMKRKYRQEDHLHNPEALKNILTIGSSIGGAQAKILLAVNLDGKILAGDLMHKEPVNYYIVKLEHDPTSIWAREKNYVELVYNQMAAEAGVNVADSKLFIEGEKAHFASKRFDRVNNQKIHTQTVNALSGFYGRNTEFSYEQIFRIMESFKLPYEDFKQLYIQMVFNVAASNRDDHTKNFSFLMSADGTWKLSPAYDLTYPFDPYQSFKVPHQISINKKNIDISRADLVAVAKKVGIRGYHQLIDQVVEAVSTFTAKIAEYGLNVNTTDLIAKDLGRNAMRLKRTK